jgi:hypothetical protein
MGASAGAMTAGSIGWVAEPGKSSANAGQFSSKVAAGVGISGCLWPFFLDGTDEPTGANQTTKRLFFVDCHFFLVEKDQLLRQARDKRSLTRNIEKRSFVVTQPSLRQPQCHSLKCTVTMTHGSTRS